MVFSPESGSPLLFNRRHGYLEEVPLSRSKEDCIKPLNLQKHKQFIHYETYPKFCSHNTYDIHGSCRRESKPLWCADANWLNHGGDLYNRRYAAKEVKISPETVSQLKLKWEFIAGKDITATPAIFNGTIYFPSWNGFIYAVKAIDGSLVWKQNLTELTGLEATCFVTGVNSTVSRATPTIAGDLLLIGIYGPAIVIAVKRSSGELVWLTQLDSHNASVVTVSGTVFNKAFYVGTSSLEESSSIEELFHPSRQLWATTRVLWSCHMVVHPSTLRGN